MRNCFVPHCDAFCKKNGIIKRMMFSAPKDRFESWSSILFNKRAFRETDRVCERHFDRSQILTHWDHIIEGELCQLEREKPKIKPDAVPYLNLPETENETVAPNKKRATKNKSEPKKRKQNLSNLGQQGKVLKIDKGFECEPIESLGAENGDNSAEQRVRSPLISNETISDEVKRQTFDAVYDDIYEVVLPNTLWGIHRDPEERRYIAFTLFNAKDMNCSIAVKISNDFNVNVFVNGVKQSEDTLDELSVDTLSKLLNQLNESADLG